MMTNKEFDNIRAELYEEALKEYPAARIEDLRVMKHLLKPQPGETILGIGEGNGYFCQAISDAIGNTGTYLVTDPSKDQLENLVQRVHATNIQIKVMGAESLAVPEKSYDKVWSFGAFHHCKEQEEAMKRIYFSLKDAGVAVICDVFQGSALARHFDGPVSRYCITGHDVNFLSDTYALTIADKVGFRSVQILEINQKWIFEHEEDIGRFIYKLHAMTLLGTCDEACMKVLRGCKDNMGIEKTNRGYELNWPMKALIAIK